jgi:hypothetical protein
MGGLAQSAPTQAERKMTVSGNEATVVENFGRTQVGGPAIAGPAGTSAAPTQVERKWDGGETGAAPTVLERQYAQPSAEPKKKNTALIGTIAAVLVIAIASVGGWFALHKPGPTPPVTTTTPSGTQVTSTGTTATPIPGDRGVLLLSASPWGDVEKIVNASDQKEVPLEGDTSTPTRIQLAPGKYLVTLSGPSGKTTVDVQIDAGKPTAKKVDMGGVNLDELEKEVTKQ